MELRPITDLEQWYARELTEAFPPNERKPLADIRALLEAGRYEALGLYDGAALLGYANLWREPAVPGYVLLGEPPARLEELMAVHRAIYGPARTDVAVPLAPGEVPPPSLFL